jgi:AcrR family transcriptional regulator
MAETCAERGYAEATVDEVTERAEVSRERFAAIFSSKEECGVAAMNEIFAETTAVASAAYSPDSSEWESILRGVRGLLELMAARPSFANVAYIQARYTMPPSTFEVYAMGIHVLSLMLDRLRAYTPDDALRPASAARAALGGAEAIIRRELAAGRAENLPLLLPDIIYGALAPFLGQREALRYTKLARELSIDGGVNRGQSEHDGLE